MPWVETPAASRLRIYHCGSLNIYAVQPISLLSWARVPIYRNKDCDMRFESFCRRGFGTAHPYTRPRAHPPEATQCGDPRSGELVPLGAPVPPRPLNETRETHPRGFLSGPVSVLVFPFVLRLTTPAVYHVF